MWTNPRPWINRLADSIRYPFHLRPKNKQAFQYVRMAVDIIVDLEIDQESSADSAEGGPGPERLDQIRMYLSTYFLVSQCVLLPFLPPQPCALSSHCFLQRYSHFQI